MKTLIRPFHVAGLLSVLALVGFVHGVATPAAHAALHPAHTADDAGAILRSARAVLAEVDRFSYSAESFGGGDLAAKVPRHTAQVRAARAEAGGWRLAVEGTQGESDKFLVGYNGATARSVREADKVVVERSISDMNALAVFLTSQGCRPPVAWELLADAPLAGDDAAATLHGVSQVDGHECDVVLMPTPALRQSEGVSALRLHIARSDSLPRRIERITSDQPGQGEQARVLELRGLSINDRALAGVYSPQVPEGFRVRATVEPIQITAPTRPAQVAPTPQPGLLAVGTQAPDWTLTDPEGVEHTLSKMRGSVVLMDFWATWCGPCKRVMPGLQRIHEHFKDKPVKVLGINCWERGDPAKYMADQRFTYGLLLKADEVAQRYGVRGIPTFYLIGKDGMIIYASMGAHPGGEQALIERIEAALSIEHARPEQP